MRRGRAGRMAIDMQAPSHSLSIDIENTPSDPMPVTPGQQICAARPGGRGSGGGPKPMTGTATVLGPVATKRHLWREELLYDITTIRQLLRRRTPTASQRHPRADAQAAAVRLIGRPRDHRTSKVRRGADQRGGTTKAPRPSTSGPYTPPLHPHICCARADGRRPQP